MKSRQEVKGGLWSAPFALMLVINFLTYMNIETIYPVLPKYIAHLGAPGSVVGLAVGAITMVSFFLRPVVGWMTDTFNQKRLLAISICALALATSFIALCRQPWLILVLSGCYGIGLSLFSTVRIAMVSGVLPKHRLSSGLGIYIIFGYCSNAVAPYLGLEIAERFGYGGTFLVSTLFCAAATALTLGLPRRDVTVAPASHRFSLHSMVTPQALLPTFFVFLSFLSYSCVTTFLAIIAEARQVGNGGVFFTVYAVASMLLRPVLGRFSDCAGERAILIPSGITAIAATLLIIYGTTSAAYILSGILYACASGLEPCMQSLCLKRVSEDKRGKATSTFYIGTDLGYCLGPILGGVLADAMGYTNMMLCTLVPLAAIMLGAVCFYPALKAPQPDSNTI